jgi:hypothetical protein
MEKLKSLSCVLSCAVLAGCGGGGGGGGDTPDGGSPGPVDMSGAIQKGPFVIGADVVVAMLDPATANPTGASFPTTTRTDFGEFDLTLPGKGAAEIQTSGFYFNEILNSVSQAPISMRALASFPSSGPREVHVNALTHLGHLRARKLVGDGMGFEAAIVQAESELRAALPLAADVAVGAGTELDILGGDSDANAYLFALSCVLAQTAFNEDPGSVDAELQEQMSVIALDLEDDGALQPAVVETLTRGVRFLDAERCKANMEAFVAEKGASATIPDIRRALDFDGDGTSDRADSDADGDGRSAAEDAIERIAASLYDRTGLALDKGGAVWTWTGGVPNASAVGCDIEMACPPLPVTALSAFGPALDVVITGDVMASFAVLLAGGRVAVWGGSTAPTPTLVPDLDRITWIGGAGRGDGPYGSLHAVRDDGSAWRIQGGTATQLTAITNARAVSVTENGSQAFWVLRTDGTVQGHDFAFTTTYAVNGLTGVVALEAGSGGQTAFAVDGDGTLWQWSVFDALQNGSVTATQVNLGGRVASLSPGALAAVLEDGSAWFLAQDGPVMPADLSNVAYLAGNAALLRDGTVVTIELGGIASVHPRPLYIPR